MKLLSHARITCSAVKCGNVAEATPGGDRGSLTNLAVAVAVGGLVIAGTKPIRDRVGNVAENLTKALGRVGDTPPDNG